MPRPRQRWTRTPGRVTDGRYEIVRDAPERLRQLNVPLFYPWALYDNGAYIKHFPNVEQAQRACDT